MRPYSRAVAFVALVFAARNGAAQVGANEHVIRGIVVDSIAGKPLAGAVVQVGTAESSRAPWSAATDTAGRYEVRGVPDGRYIVGFYHDALTMLGLDAPSRSVVLGGERDVTVDLAIPSSATIRALRCGASAPFRQGMVVGFVRDAESLGAVAGATATIHWRAMALDSANYRVVEEQTDATIDPDGSLLACGLPVDAPLDVRVTAPGRRTVRGTVVNVPSSGIGRVDVLLVDSALINGPAVIRGRVVRENGRSVASGRVVIAGLNRDVPIQDGVFTVGGMPAGSWVAEARVVGVEPKQTLVTAADSAVALATMTVSDAPQMLDAVTVVGKMSRDLTVLDEVLRRKRIGSGTTFLPGHPALKSALFTADVMREARGFRYISPTEIVARTNCRFTAVYVDDVRIPDGFVSLEDWAPVSQVLAIETWPDIRLAPVQYRRGMMPSLPKPPSLVGGAQAKATSRAGDPDLASTWSVCALVLVWTKRPF